MDESPNNYSGRQPAPEDCISLDEDLKPAPIVNGKTLDKGYV